MAETCYQQGVLMKEQTRREVESVMQYKRTSHNGIKLKAAVFGSAVGAAFSLITIVPNVGKPTFTGVVMALNLAFFSTSCAAAAVVGVKVSEDDIYNLGVDEMHSRLLSLPKDQARQELHGLLREVEQVSAVTAGLTTYANQQPQRLDIQPAQAHTQQGAHAYGQLRDIPQSHPVPPVQPSDVRWLNLPD
jgi:hypothetical protein